MLQSVAYSHIKMCLAKKNERAQKKKEQKEANRKAREAREKAEKAAIDAQDNDSDEDSNAGDKGAKKAVKGAIGKKRKADTEAEKNISKKKTKKEIEAAKPKLPKPKGPVDVEKQCGVMLPNGAMCARSLTCKSHAMGAKRAVPGRSQPYDYLLAAYQKKNQAKQQSALGTDTRILQLLTLSQKRRWTPMRHSSTTLQRIRVPSTRTKRRIKSWRLLPDRGPSPWLSTSTSLFGSSTSACG
jgi:hypothetical protein